MMPQAAYCGGERWKEIDGRVDPWIDGIMLTREREDEGMKNLQDGYDAKRRADFNLRVGTALETLRRQLPLVFYVSSMDYSIFANMITLADGNRNKLVVQKSFYIAAINSLRMAASLSSIYPGLNLKKIEYVEDSRTIHCLVDMVLPDTVRVDGQSMWQGNIYFGLNADGLIDTMIFDRKINPFRPQMPSTYPWFQQTTRWQSELIAVSVPLESSIIDWDDHEHILQ
eukprot:gene6449-7113_t